MDVFAAREASEPNANDRNRSNPRKSAPAMNRTIELMAELTESRDREMLDRRMALVLSTLLRAQGVTLASLIGEGPQQRWLTRSRCMQGMTDPDMDTPFIDPGELPAPDTQPGWLVCLHDQQPIQSTDEPSVSLWPLPTDAGTCDVLELWTDTPLSPEDRYRLMGMLRIYRNMSSLLDGCERDPLTGLLNRWSFEKTVLQAIAVFGADHTSPYGGFDSRRPALAAPQWLGVLDIDHFKQVNDAHGHVIGDEVLVLVARILRNTFRACDRLYRFGGEEFAVLLSAPDALSAGAAFERLREHMEGFAFPRVGRVTASIGFSGLRRGDLPQAAFERADRAVYHGKRNGRNQVHSFEALLAQGLLRAVDGTGTIELFERPAVVSGPVR